MRLLGSTLKQMVVLKLVGVNMTKKKLPFFFSRTKDGYYSPKMLLKELNKEQGSHITMSDFWSAYKQNKFYLPRTTTGYYLIPPHMVEYVKKEVWNWYFLGSDIEVPPYKFKCKHCGKWNRI